MSPVGGGARAAASGVLSVCVAGAPLYVSSVGSESIQLQLSQMCLADAGLFMFLGQAGTSTFAGKPKVRSGMKPAPDDVESHLAAVGLGDCGAKRVRQLSGGEQLRLALACAMAGDPPVVVADEPTASLDRDNAAAMVDAMRSAADRGATLVVASHDTHILDRADHIVRLDHGRRVS